MKLKLLVVLALAGPFAVGQSVLFYNVENLFDTIDDRHFSDEAFLPDSPRQYGSMRYFLKIRQTARALRMALNECEQHVDCIGLAEVETYGALAQLARHNALRSLGPWTPLLFDSEDHRGIDCAALLHSSCRLLYADRIRYSDSNFRTRDALYLRYKNRDSIVLNLIIVHLPSKRGGTEASQPKRERALTAIQAVADTCTGKVLICGDFNDDLKSKTYQRALQRGYIQPQPMGGSRHAPQGSYKYQGRWSTIDVGLFRGATNLQYRIIWVDELVENDPKWGNFRPKRSWKGTFYTGGYSDHLPVHFLFEVD
jgi:endonuclease/exonuclease/phosphatase family metal-dependent hydrolase